MNGISVDVNITFEEYEEAVAALREKRALGQQRRVEKLAGIYVLLTFFAVGFLIVIARFIDPYPYIRPPMYPVVAVILPMVIAVALLLTTNQRVLPKHQSQTGPTKGILGWVVAVLLLVPLMWLIGRTPAAVPTDWFGTLFPHLGWTLIAAWAALMVIRAQRQEVKTLWESTMAIKPQLRYSLGADGVAVEQSLEKRQYQWLAFIRYIETENLLLLCPTQLSCEILPKRVFESPDDLEMVRRWCTAEIRDASAAPPAFPVIVAETGDVSSDAAR